ncbi:MAG: ATP-binding protein [Bacteroidota bacterium]
MDHRDPRIQSFETLAYVGGVVILLFGIVNKLPGAESADPFWLRAVVAGLCIGNGLALRYSERAIRHFHAVAHTVIGAVTAWQFYLIWLNALQVTKVLGLAIVVVVCILGFRETRALGIYSILATAACALLAIVVPEPEVSPLYFVVTIGTICGMGTIMLRARLRLEAELRQARERAETSDAAKSVYVATMSHEIRTPVNAMVGMADVLLDTELNAEQHEIAAMLHRAGRSLSTLIDNVLDFSKLDAGKVELDAQPFVLRPSLETLIDMVAQRATGADVDLVLHIEPDVPDEILADETRLQQVLLNLLSNAVKFTREGHVVLRVERARADADGAVLRFAVTDTGAGIPPERQAAIFDPYAQAEASTTRNYGGTGLGLTIVRRLVELMGGTITVESEVGRGSTFRTTLPVGRVSDAEPAPESDTAGACVLLISTSPVRAAALDALAQKHGVALATVSTLDALDATLELASPHAVVLDVAHSTLGSWREALATRDVPRPVVTLMPLGASQEGRPGDEIVLVRPVRADHLLPYLRPTREATSTL